MQKLSLFFAFVVLFTINVNSPVFNTGLFCIKSSTLLQYIQYNSPQLLVTKRLVIEYSIYNFFLRNKIHFDTRKKMNLIWYDKNISRHW